MIALMLIVVFLLVFQDLLLCTYLILSFQDHFHFLPDAKLPKVTVLLPARNEAKSLPACLEALSQIDYPKEKLQFVVGNDGSTDETGSILEKWARGEGFIHYVKVKPYQKSKMNGKAHALAEMLKEAKGDFLLFTDADCQVGPLWVREMVGAAFGSRADLVTGITSVRDKGFFGTMQSMDWWLTLGMVKVLADLQTSVTSMGNNMLLSKEAYQAIGGFEALPFSVTEDFEIAKAVAGIGGKAVHQVSPASFVATKGAEGFWDLLKQRKRWMKGAMGLSFFWKFLLALQVLFFPAILLLLLLVGWWALPVWAIKIWIQGFLIYYFAGKAGVNVPWKHLAVFEFYYLFISWSTIVYYFWPAKLEWKGRTYP